MRTRKSGLRILLGIGLAVAITWYIARKQQVFPPLPGTHSDLSDIPPDGRRTAAGAAEFWVSGTLVDPKEFKVGHWVALTFPIGSPPDRLCKRLLMKDEGVLYARLAPSLSTATLPSGPVPLWASETCAPAPGKDGLWIRGNIMPSKWSFRSSLNYGIERHFVVEKPLVRNKKDPRVLARVAVDPAGGLKLLELTPFVVK